MKNPPTALLVSPSDLLLELLQDSLELIGIKSAIADGWGQASSLLESKEKPKVIFTDSILLDGTCIDVLRLSAKAAGDVPVIVVWPGDNYDLYLDAMEAGAADFLTPPFTSADVAWVLCSVMQNRVPPRLQVA